MSDLLRFPAEGGNVKTCTLEGRTIVYRAFENLSYCARPADPIQKMNLFVPEAYYRGESIGGYTRATAPIFLPNTVGGYMPGPADAPGFDHRAGRLNSVFLALEHGYVVASPGVRGRTSGKASNEFFEGGKAEKPQEATGRMVGRAPALIVDYKAAIRYLRHNRDLIPGDTERIVTNGTSAGGALSALAGATGNSPDYEPFLEQIGAAKERDDIFAASCYCPIHNLENADSAYEWLFAGHNDYHHIRIRRTEKGFLRVPEDGRMTPEQIALSAPLKALFPAYLNGLSLRDETGNVLTLDANGEGSFKEYVKRLLIAAAQRELDTRDNETHRRALMVQGSEAAAQSYLRVENGRVTDLDWDAYVTKITRMKSTPAFDALDLKSPENEEFGNETITARHFTAFSLKHSAVPGALAAEPEIIRLLNPTLYIGQRGVNTAKHWRIRHGAFDRDTSLAIPVILALLLENNGCGVDFALPWGLPHSGDYDLPELFAWIDGVCGN